MPEQWIRLMWTMTRTYTSQVPLSHVLTCYRDDGRTLTPDDVIAALNDQSAATGRVLSQAAPEWSYTEPVELNDFRVVQAETYELD